ncbi:MAG: recombinase family protein [Firmicutes bacterium]|nr:recombinase family protein [Bacillota bacterium]
MYNNYLIEQEFNVGIYIRLSQEDKDKKYESDSESVINQKELLKSYVKNNNFNLSGEYVDDGYSGTNFDRPGFQKMLEDIKKKKINCVIVKDLSRFGRDHVMTGYYIETFFPENSIRFISILESYDSFKNQASNDSSTFIIACNDYYSKQNSIKIKNVLNDKRRNGKFIGSKPSYGYMRDPEDKGHLIPDPKTAPAVKKIFKWRVDGIGPTEIATRLNNENIPTPSQYKNIKFSSRIIIRDEWNISSVKKILTNRIYTGDMVQHTQSKVNYKSKKKITLDKSLWIIVENTHEPLVDKKTFEYVQTLKNRHSRNYALKTTRPKRIFEGKIYCKECGNRLSVYYRKKLDYWSINCNRYSRDPKRGRCSSHFYPYDYLEQQLLEQFESAVSIFINELDLQELNREVVKNIHKETESIDKIIDKLTLEKEQIINRLSNLYNDRCDGIITAELYKELSVQSEKKLKKINNSIETEKNKIENIKNKANILPDYTKKIKKLLDLNKPKKELIDALIDKIVIDENRNINIKFKYEVIPEINFKYENRNLSRNPYDKNVKKYQKKSNL